MQNVSRYKRGMRPASVIIYRRYIIINVYINYLKQLTFAYILPFQIQDYQSGKDAQPESAKNYKKLILETSSRRRSDEP